MLPHQVLLLSAVLGNQWRSPEDLAAIQARKLERLLRHHHATNPFYREVMDRAGVRPRDIRGPEDLSRLPILTKSDLKNVPRERLISRGFRWERCRTFVTSGTTGTPFEMAFSRSDCTRNNLYMLRIFFAYGYRPTERFLELTGWRRERIRRHWYERLGIMRREAISMHDPRDTWADRLFAWEPHMVLGYSLNLKLVADEIAPRGHRFRNLRFVVSTSGVLDDATRRHVGSVFGCPVRDMYASSEGGFMAWECPACGAYHINSDTAVLEVVREDGTPAPPGEPGEIVVTNLHSRAMPFIRYRQDDIGVLSARSPACGRGLPLLESVLGRTDDFIALPSGRSISPHVFQVIFCIRPEIRLWRVIQDESGGLRAEVVREPWASPDLAEVLAREITDFCSGEVPVAVEYRDEIPRDPSRKLRTIVSRYRL